MGRPLNACVTALLAVGLSGPAAAHDPADPGPYAAGRLTLTLPTGGAVDRPTDVHFPVADDGTVDPVAGLLPVVVFGHGFTRSKERYRDLGALLASRGVVVLVPDLPCGFAGCDHSANADELLGLVDWILERDLDPDSPFFGRIDRAAIGAAGHSAGGMWSLVAAGRDPRVVAVAPLDPVDSGMLGATSVATARAAVGPVWSEPSSCNAQGSAVALYAAAPPPRRGVLIVGGTHCDPEINADVLGCTLVCGYWNAERHRAYLRYVSAWFGAHLLCDPADRAWVDGEALAADAAAGVVEPVADLRPPVPPPPIPSVDGAAVRLERDPPPWCGARDAWRVFRDDGAGLELVADGLAPGTTSWIDGDVAGGRTYAYVVQDVIRPGAGESVRDSAAAEVTLPAPTPGEPRLLDVRRLPDGSIEATVDAPACAVALDVHAFVAAGAPGAAPAWTVSRCDAGGGSVATFDPGAPPTGSWAGFVIVAADGGAQGSFGRDAAGAERAPSDACRVEQRLAPACPAR